MTRTSLPVSGARRGLRVGRAVVEAGAEGLRARLSGVDADPAGRTSSASILLSALLDLRGAALKVAQFLSLESDLLPEATARALADPHRGTPPIGPELARHIVKSQLGPIDTRFASFAWTPFAAASIGQVHEAVLLDGRKVAVKIQYPGVAATIRADLRLLRRAVALLPHGRHHLHLFNEVEARLIEECDYEREADSLAWFRRRIGIDGIHIPDVIPALSSVSVLTTEHLEGQHLNDWLATRPSQDARDRAGQRIYDLFTLALHRHGRIHADPNPGNYLFTDDGAVGVIDFGCTRDIPPDCEALIRRVWRSAIAGDDSAAQAVYRDMGLFGGASSAEANAIDGKSLKPFRDWLAIPFRSERHVFGADARFVSEGRDRFFAMVKDESLVGIRPEFVLVNRTLYGLYRIFESLGARIACRTTWTAG